MLDTDIYDSVRMYLDTVGIRYTTCELTCTFRFRSEEQVLYHLRVARGTLWLQAVWPYKLPPGWVKRFSAESAAQSSGLVLDVSRGELQYRLRIPCDGGCATFPSIFRSLDTEHLKTASTSRSLLSQKA